VLRYPTWEDVGRSLLEKEAVSTGVKTSKHRYIDIMCVLKLCLLWPNDRVISANLLIS
jgi:hypothetical protein